MSEAWPPVAAHLHVCVEDVDATYRRALEAGGESIHGTETPGVRPGPARRSEEPGREYLVDREAGRIAVEGTAHWPFSPGQLAC